MNIHVSKVQNIEAKLFWFVFFHTSNIQNFCLFYNSTLFRPKSKGIYLLKKDTDNKHFGSLFAEAKYPDYKIKVNLYIYNGKVNKNIEDETGNHYELDINELTIIGKVSLQVEHAIKQLISLAKRNKLKDNAYSDLN